MHYKNTHRKTFRFRSAVFGLSAAGLFFACIQLVGQSARVGGGERSRFMERIDEEEGVRHMAEFRRQRLDGDFCFKFELEHLPRRGETVRYEGKMWGSWNDIGPVSRIELYPEPTAAEVGHSETIHLIIQNGAEPCAWVRKGVQQDFDLIVGDDVFEPVLPDVVYSPFDLQMPFIYWQDFEYEGPSRIRSRVVQNFRMLPPAHSTSEQRGVGAVRIALDNTYHALFQVEVLDAIGGALSRFTVESFKKIQGQYIVKEVTLKDYATKDRTRFKVKAASVGLFFNPDFFDPKKDADFPVIEKTMFDAL